MSAFDYRDPDGGELATYEDSDHPDSLIFLVPRSFEDDVADRDSHAVLDVEAVTRLHDFLGEWLNHQPNAGMISEGFADDEPD